MKPEGSRRAAQSTASSEPRSRDGVSVVLVCESNLRESQREYNQFVQFNKMCQPRQALVLAAYYYTKQAKLLPVQNTARPHKELCQQRNWSTLPRLLFRRGISILVTSSTMLMFIYDKWINTICTIFIIKNFPSHPPPTTEQEVTFIAKCEDTLESLVFQITKRIILPFAYNIEILVKFYIKNDFSDFFFL